MANRIRGITVEINGDTTGLQESLSKVDKSIRNTQSQLKDVEKLLKLNPTNTELLAQKQRLLGEAIGDTKERLEALKTASDEAAKTKDNYDDWKAKYDPIKEKIGETTKELKKLKEQSEKANEQLSKGEISQEEYDKLQNKVKETSDKLEDLKKSAEDVSKEFGHPVSQEQFDAIQREIIETEQELQNLQREAENSRESLVKIGKAGEGLQNIGGKISGAGEALMPVTAGIVGLGTLAVKTGAEFDSAMSQVSAVSGATGEDLEALRSKAREMGSETKFSASEAAEAMNYMAMAGWKTEDMLNGVEGIMNLAAASGEELGTTSDIVTDALTALGYQAQDAGHFADVLAAASSNANTNVSMMGESFQYVAPVAGSMGASAEDLAIALGLMANSGIKASQAGNSLKNGLVNLVKPTEAQVAAMSALGLAYTETVQVFDDDAIAKAQEKVDKKTREYENAAIRQKDAVERYGESSSQAQIATNNLEGKLEELHKAQEALTVAQQGTTKEVLTGADAFTDEYGNMKSLGEIMDVLRSSLGKIDVALVDSEGNAREYDDIIEELSQTEEGLVQSEQLKNAAILFGKQNLSGMLAIVNASEEDYEKLTNAIYNCDGTAQGMAETMQDNLEGQLTILMSQLQELAISFAEILMPAIRNIVTKIQNLVDKFNALSPHTKETITKVALIVAAIGPLLILIGKLTTGIGGMMTVFSKMPAIMTKVKGGFTAVKTAIMGISAPVVAIVAVIAVLTAAFKHLWDTNEDFRNSITAIWDGIKATFERLTSGIVDRLNALGFSFSDITEVIKAVWDVFCNWLAPIFENTFKYIGEILNAAVDVILGIVDFFIGLFTGNWETCWNGIKEIFTGIWDAIKSTIETV
ncbi:MAG: phage tail tape measure protein, partial [Ruminococcus sp.]|nr:phage tail tape measure protein [Ruminococcus sp.]